MELERAPDGAGPTYGLAAETLRLELALLLDACRSERWRLLLNMSQRLSLMSIIVEVLDALNASSEIEPHEAIAWAQNRLLDVILEHCAAQRRRTSADRAHRTKVRTRDVPRPTPRQSSETARANSAA